MTKLPKTRVVLIDTNRECWRLCNISHSTDGRGEKYFKIMLPDWKSGTYSQGMGLRESDGSLHRFAQLPNVKCEPAEITYHYLAGLRHLKTRTGEYMGANRKFPNIKRADRSILVCRFLMQDFKSCTKIPTAKDEDAVIENVKCPCVIGLYLTFAESEKRKTKLIERTDGRSIHFEDTQNPNFIFTVTLYETDVPMTGLMLNDAAFAYEDSIEFWEKLIYKSKKAINRIFPVWFQGY